jgi:hypothetical protein
MPATRERHLTATTARAVHDTAITPGQVPMWFVFSADPAFPGKVTARGYVADHRGGVLLGVLVAATLDELRAMLPAGLTRRERAPVHPADVIETWD